MKEKQKQTGIKGISRGRVRRGVQAAVEVCRTRGLLDRNSEEE